MKDTKMNKSLAEEINRYNKIISYNNLNETVYSFYNEADDEQEPMTDPNMEPQTQDDQGMAQDAVATPQPDMSQQAPATPEVTPPLPPVTPSPDMSQQNDVTGMDQGGDTEIDVTELVTNSHDIVQKLDKTSGHIQRIYDKINDLEGSLSKMDTIIQTMTALEKQVELMRPPTEGERRRALADKSYPYNVTNSDYVEGVGYKNQTSMENKPDKMSMMDNLMANYDKSDIKKSFNLDNDDNVEKY